MKAKKILITYLNNGNIQSQVAKEYLFNNIVNSLVAEGREINDSKFMQDRKLVSFTDGTKVQLVPFGRAVLGMRITHLYVDKGVFQISQANELINEVYKPSVIHGNYINFDTSDKDRMFTFDYQNGEIILKSI